MKDERARASRRRFKEGQLRPILRPMAVGCSVPLILAGWVVQALSGLGSPNPDEAHVGWSLVGVGTVLLLWALLSGFLERRKRERAREERAKGRDCG